MTKGKENDLSRMIDEDPIASAVELELEGLIREFSEINLQVEHHQISRRRGERKMAAIKTRTETIKASKRGQRWGAVYQRYLRNHIDGPEKDAA